MRPNRFECVPVDWTRRQAIAQRARLRRFNRRLDERYGL